MDNDDLMLNVTSTPQKISTTPSSAEKKKEKYGIKNKKHKNYDQQRK